MVKRRRELLCGSFLTLHSHQFYLDLLKSIWILLSINTLTKKEGWETVYKPETSIINNDEVIGNDLDHSRRKNHLSKTRNKMEKKKKI